MRTSQFCCLLPLHCTVACAQTVLGVRTCGGTGSGRQRVPLMMYFHAHYFFVTYHAASIVVIRRARHATRRLETLTRVTGTASAAAPRSSSTWFGGRQVFYSSVAWALAMLPYAGTAIAFAWLEIYATSAMRLQLPRDFLARNSESLLVFPTVLRRAHFSLGNNCKRIVSQSSVVFWHS